MEAQASRIPSSCRNHSSTWFQLAKFRLTTLRNKYGLDRFSEPDQFPLNRFGQHRANDPPSPERETGRSALTDSRTLFMFAKVRTMKALTRQTEEVHEHPPHF